MPNKVDNHISNIAYNESLKRMNCRHNQATPVAARSPTSHIGRKRNHNNSNSYKVAEHSPKSRISRKRRHDEVATVNPGSYKIARTVSQAPEIDPNEKAIAIEATVKKFIYSIDSAYDNEKKLYNEEELYSVFHKFYSNIKKHTPLDINCIEKFTPVLDCIIKNIDNKILSVYNFCKILYWLSDLKIFNRSCTTLYYRNTSRILLSRILELAPDISRHKNKDLVSILFSLCLIAYQDRSLFIIQDMDTLLKKVVNKLHINSLDNKSRIKLLSGLSMLIGFHLLTVSDNIKNIISDILERLRLDLSDTDRRDPSFEKLKTSLSYLQKEPQLKPIIDNYRYLSRLKNIFMLTSKIQKQN